MRKGPDTYQDACIKEIMMRAMQQASGPDRRSSIIVDALIAALEENGFAIGSIK